MRLMTWTSFSQLVALAFALTHALVACGGGDDASSDAGHLSPDGAASDGALPRDGAPLPTDDGGPEPQPLRRVLFVGNSYTYVNDLPIVIEALGEANATPFEVEAITVGGATLYDHWVSTGARARIEMGDLDVVVLQGQSQEAFGEGFLGAATLFASILTDTDTVWYATWARHESDPMFSGSYTPAVMTDLIDRGYRDAAAINGDTVARVGAAWELARQEHHDIRLHQPDGSHPLPEGTLLAACVIYQAITGREAILPDPLPLDVDRAVAETLCALAPRVRCPFETAACGDACANVVSDPDHCGGCDVACGAEEPCLAGVCGCPAGLTACARTCVYTPGDVTNCGACGVTCEGGEVCSDGACLCEQATPQTVTLADLPSCGTWDPDATNRVACNADAHAHCAAQACFDSGFGPPGGHSPRLEQVMCVRGDVHTTSLAELATYEPACTDAATSPCATAIHRYCRALGATSGFGPIAETPSSLDVTCIPAGTVVSTTLTELGGFASRCIPDPITCNVAAWSYCESLGHPGGFGPVESDTTAGTAEVVCFDR